MFFVVTELDDANRKVSSLDIQVQILEKEKRDLNQSMLLSMLLLTILYLCSDCALERR